MNRLVAFLAVLADMVLPAPKGRHREASLTSNTPGASAAPIPAVRIHPYSQGDKK